MNFKLIAENLQGKNKGGAVADSNAANFFFTPPVQGEYKVEATLANGDGKEIVKKSGVITVKGATPGETKPAADADSDDKSEDKEIRSKLKRKYEIRMFDEV